MVAYVRDRALDPRLVAPDQRNHARAVDSLEGVAFTAVQHDAHVRPWRADGLVPVEEKVDDTKRMSGDRHVEVGIVNAEAMRGANHQYLCVASTIDGDACCLSQ